MKKYIFLMGCDRSGTTALAKFLNRHKEIVMGMERFKYLIRDHGIEALHKEMLTVEYISDVKKNETNIDWEYYNLLIKSKEKNSVKLIGDKLPRYFEHIDYIIQHYSNPIILFLLRNPYSVAKSWDVRAKNKDDVNWPLQNDYVKAVNVWNKSLLEISKFLDYKNLLIVSYEDMLEDKNFFQKLFKRLSVNEDSVLVNTIQAEIKEQRKINDDYIIDYVNEHANFKLYKKVLQKKSDIDSIAFENSLNFFLKTDNIEEGLKKFENNIVYIENNFEACINYTIYNDTALNSKKRYSYKTWKNESHINYRTYVLFMNNAKLFPGKIVRKGLDQHDYGQLLLNSNNNLVYDSYNFLGGRETLPSDITSNNIFDAKYKEINDVCYFIGSIHQHFGHFILEGLSRLWFMSYLKNQKIKFIVYEKALPKFVLFFLKFLGINIEDIILLTEPVVCKKLIVPSLGYKTHCWTTAQQQNFFQSIGEKVKKTDKAKIYISRKFNSNRRMKNENEIEKYLSSKNFKIIYPEKIGIMEQLEIICNASLIITPIGSNSYLHAFNNSCDVLIFAPDNFIFKDDILLGFKNKKIMFFTGTSVEIGNKDSTWNIDINNFIEYYSNLEDNL